MHLCATVDPQVCCEIECRAALYELALDGEKDAMSVVYSCVITQLEGKRMCCGGVRATKAEGICMGAMHMPGCRGLDASRWCRQTRKTQAS